MGGENSFEFHRRRAGSLLSETPELGRIHPGPRACKSFLVGERRPVDLRFSGRASACLVLISPCAETQKTRQAEARVLIPNVESQKAHRAEACATDIATRSAR